MIDSARSKIAYSRLRREAHILQAINDPKRRITLVSPEAYEAMPSLFSKKTDSYLNGKSSISIEKVEDFLRFSGSINTDNATFMEATPFAGLEMTFPRGLLISGVNLFRIEARGTPNLQIKVSPESGDLGAKKLANLRVHPHEFRVFELPLRLFEAQQRPGLTPLSGEIELLGGLEIRAFSDTPVDFFFEIKRAELAVEGDIDFVVSRHPTNVFYPAGFWAEIKNRARKARDDRN